MFLSRYTAIAFGFFAVVFPVSIPCGSHLSGCTATTDYRGRVQHSSELKPLSVTLLQQVVGAPLPIKYR
ncbi:MAG: hypothetical protein HC824_18560 [Synechococcales cyanobacterium RM1_1_8]|nr:hypothetical protein [Synechococcales cyanobacterium RM1_1_8]